MKTIGIYKITSPSGRVYVGQSVNIERRFKTYVKLLCKEQPILYRSFLKHGVKNHTFEILQECTILELNDRERHWQDFYNVTGKGGLNCILISANENRVVYSEETLLRMSKNSSGSKNNMFGRKLDPHPMQGKKGSLSPLFGRKHSEETKLLQAEKAKVRPITELSKLKISEANGKKVVNKITGEIFNSIRKAAESCGMKQVTLKAALAGKFQNKTNFEVWTNRN